MPIRHKYVNMWIIISDILKFLSRSSHFSTQHNAEHATLAKNNRTHSFGNNLNGLKVHFLGSVVFLHVEYLVSVSILSTIDDSFS